MSNENMPRGWTWATLEEVVVTGRASITDGPFGSNLKSEHYTHSGPRVVRLQNIGDGRFVDEHAHISGEHFERLRKHEVVAGDLLIAMLGEELPRACIAPPSLGPAIVKADCVRARVETSVITTAYAMYALNCDQTRHLAAAIVHGVGRPRLNLGKLKALRFPLAPRAEQDRIVTTIEQHLSGIDAGVTALKRVLVNLERYRASVLTDACVGRLVPTAAEIAHQNGREYEPASVLLQHILTEHRARWEADQLAKMTAKGQVPRDDRWKDKYEEPKGAETSELPNLPDGWAWTNLRSIADLKGGVTKGQTRRENDVLRAVPYLRVANVQRGYLDLGEVKEIEATEEEIEDLRLIQGDVLFNEGGDRDKLGRGWIWQEQIPLCIHQNHVFRARLIGGLVESKFLSWHGNSFGQKYFTDEGKQTTNLASINMTKLGAFPVPLPPLAEQHRIVAEVDRLLSVADEIEHEVRALLTRAKGLRQAVLKHAFEGKLVPQDPGDEPASVLLERLAHPHEGGAASKAASRPRTAKVSRGARASTTVAREPPETGK